jgi:putative endopeptidase
MASIDPRSDFFQYVNAQWIAENPIPADESQWGSFYTLRFDVEEQLHKLLDDVTAASKPFPAGSDEQKVADFYKSAMDLAGRDRLGVAPLAEFFGAIDAIANLDDLARAMGILHRAGIGVFFNVFAGQDEKQSEVIALQFWQGGLGLPDRDYYLNDDEKNRTIRADYVTYMKDLLVLTGLPADADRIMAIETRLAAASLTRVELRDVEKMYNKLTLSAFATLAPKISLVDYFSSIPAFGVKTPEYLIVGQPKFFAEVNEIFETVSLDDMKAYLRWHVVNTMTAYLTEAIERRAFEFYGITFNGTREMKPLWRRALRATDAALDEVLGKLYVARYFNEDAKKKIKDLVEHLSAAYRARIEKLDWMSGETKQKALEKLGTVSKKLGYPDVWKNYEGLMIDPAVSFAEHALAATRFEFDRKMREVGGAVNRAEWLMSPQTVNAYYMPPMNDIVFPAAILQPPFFDPAAEDAVNFGGIGTVIGHELTHGFDDQGSRFDAHGNLHEWWTPEDKERFDAQAERLAMQFDAYEPLPGAHVNGRLTLGENIADLGGLLIAFDGLKLAQEGNLTADDARKFFTSYAVTERSHAREELMRLRLQVDPHSPSEFRVNGPLSNMIEFYDAFGVASGDGLWREENDRVRIW